MPKAVTLNDAQLVLVPAYSTTYSTHATAILALLNRAVRENAISHEQLAQVTGKDPSHLSRMLAGKGAHPSLDVIAAIMALDTRAIVICGLAGMCGREAVEKKPDPAAENKRLREELHAMRDHLEKLLGGTR